MLGFCFLPKRQAKFGPAGDAAGEIPGFDPGFAQGRSDALANLVTVDAIDDHGLARRDLPPPFGNMVGCAALRRREHPAVGIERCRSPHVENQRRRRAAEQIEKITGGYRSWDRPYMRAPRLAKLAQRLDGCPSNGVPAITPRAYLASLPPDCNPGGRREHRGPTVPDHEGDASVCSKAVTTSTKRIAVESAASTLSAVTTDPGPVS